MYPATTQAERWRPRGQRRKSTAVQSLGALAHHSILAAAIIAVRGGAMRVMVMRR
jgi:hypothetical protein